MISKFTVHDKVVPYTDHALIEYGWGRDTVITINGVSRAENYYYVSYFGKSTGTTYKINDDMLGIDFIDNNFRLATKAELVLYENK